MKYIFKFILVIFLPLTFCTAFPCAWKGSSFTEKLKNLK